jgi:hypothetical protein
VAWLPREDGHETTGLLDRKLEDQESRREVLSGAVDVLSRCVPPSDPVGRRTGLVVGYVQSGKTLSFTTVAALANDNGYPLVIVVAGTTNELSKQSTARLVADLAIEETPFRRWRHFHNPPTGEVESIRNVLRNRRDPRIPKDDHEAVLITVIKNHTRLQTLVGLLRALGEDVAVPALVIDDEADQASLNTLVNANNLSTTYRRLRDLRDVLPHHSFLQYTATPQANLLINIIDTLSPDFAKVLLPGKGYTGGGVFFGGATSMARSIPVTQIPPAGQRLLVAPESLLEAMAVFFIGVASGIVRRAAKPRNRSMMVHPSSRTAGHGEYHNCVLAVQSNWGSILRRPDGDEDRLALLEIFRRAYRDVEQTVSDLEKFDDLSARLAQAVTSTQVSLVNSLPQAQRNINFKSFYSWILVGGNVLDRGFTVEGLTVTYMPRGAGLGNADTIQQRARFFGYKQDYLGFCRVFLEPQVAAAYVSYVRHEEDVRSKLKEHSASGADLRTLKRAFLLDPTLRPTRQNVIDLAVLRPQFAGGWCMPRAPHEVPAAVEHNKGVVERFEMALGSSWAPDSGSADRTQHQINPVVELPLSRVFTELLGELDHPNMQDSAHFTAALMFIDQYLQAEPGAMCNVYRMSGGMPRDRAATDGQIDNSFQGANPGDGSIYPGDRLIHGSHRVAVQIHRVNIADKSASGQVTKHPNVPAVLVWLDPGLREGAIVQPENIRA